MQSHSAPSPQEFWLECVQPRVTRIQNMRSLDKSGGVARAHRMIDDEFAAVHVAMCALHTERNALTPVCRLPSEILARIFLSCAQMYDWQPKMYPEYWPPPYLGWLEVTHVCKYWRETALHYPQLWTDIQGSFSIRWLEVMLARGKSAPLSIITDEAPAIAAIRDQQTISRLRDIGLYTNDRTTLMPTLKSMLAFPADVLQCLDLALDDDVGCDIRFPEHIFRGHAPMLRSLELRNIYIPWSAPIFCNLKHLRTTVTYDAMSVAVDPSNSESSTSYDCLLDALRGMPALETLYLVNRLPSKGDDGIVVLPHLRSLHLKDRTNRCSYVVKHLVIPSSCELTLFCADVIEAQFITEVASFFHAHVNREQTPLQMLGLSVDDDSSWFRFSYTITDLGSQYTLALPHRDWDGNTSRPWDTVATLCYRFPMGSIRHLNIMISIRYTIDQAESLVMQSHDELLGMLRRMPALERLEITDSACCLPYRSGDSVDKSVIDLPCLKFLLVEATTTRCLNLIKCLRIPSACDIDWICSEDAEAQSMIPEVMFLFHAHVNREWQTPLQSLVLTVDHAVFGVRTSRTGGDQEAGISYHLQFPHPKTDRTRYPQPSRENIAALCHGLPLERIRHLKLMPSNYDLKNWAPQEWLGLLGRYGTVEDVHFVGEDSQKSAALIFFRALAMHINEEGSLFLQNLRRLTLDICGHSGDSGQFYESILNQLDARQKVKRIQTIVITESDIPEWFITDLKKIVPKVQKIGYWRPD